MSIIINIKFKYAEFSTAKYAATCKPLPRKTGFSSSLPFNFRLWFEQEFETVPDALTVPQVIATTGYINKDINRWLRQEHLKSVQTTKIIAKQWSSTSTAPTPTP